MALENGKIYTVAFDGVILPKKEAQGIMPCVWNKTQSTIMESCIFDVEVCRTTDGTEWTFDIYGSGEEGLQLILYAGICGETEGVEAIYKDVEMG